MKKIANNGSNTTVLFFLFACIFIFGQLQRLSLPIGTLYIHDITILVYIVVTFCLSPAKITTTIGNDLTSLRRSIPYIVLSVLTVSIQTVIHSFLASTLTPILYLARLAMYTIFLLVIKSTVQKKVIQKTWLVVILCMLYLGFLQYFFLPDARILAVLGWDDHYYRLIGTLFDPSFTGFTFVIGLILLIAKQRLNLLNYVLIIALTAGLVLTYSRASWLALAIALGYFGIYSWLRRTRQKQIFTRMVVIVLTAVSSFLLAPKPGGEGVQITRTSTITARAAATQAVLTSNSFKEMLIGTGLFIREESSSPVPYHPRVPDNSLVMILKGGGIISVSLFIIGFSKLLRTEIKRPIMFMLLIGLFVHSMFSASIIHPFIFLLFWGVYSSIDD